MTLGRPSPEAMREAIAALRELLADRLVTAAAALEAHGHGEAMHQVMPPDAVAFVETTEEIAAALRLCSRLSIPVIPFGAGTSLEGHLQAVSGGISLDLSRMDQVLEINPEDLDCRVQAGVRREQLNEAIRDQGLFFPLDPGANATLGGMASTRASGTNAVRYGTMKDVVLSLTVVTPDGEIITTGGRARKSAAGYDLTRLYVGAEGTLGVISELRLRLFGIPEQIAAGVCQFETLEGSVDAVIQVLQMGVPIARIELLDEVQTGACIAWSKLDHLKPVPTLFLEFHGSPAAVAEQAGQVRDIAAANGGGDLQWAVAAEDRNRLWKARHDAYWAGRSLAPGKESVVTDACVPISKLAGCIAAAKHEAAASGLICPIVGHVGDGNFHVQILFDPADPGEAARAEALAQSVARLAIAAGGTCTGEHGIGLHKLGLLVEEHGPGTVAVMSRIKQALDPLGIMNPGKTVPDLD